MNLPIFVNLLGHIRLQSEISKKFENKGIIRSGKSKQVEHDLLQNDEDDIGTTCREKFIMKHCREISFIVVLKIPLEFSRYIGHYFAKHFLSILFEHLSQL